MRSTSEFEPTSQSVAPMLLALGLGFAVGFGWIAHDWVTAAFIFLIMFAIYRGYRRGAIKIAAGVIGILLAIRFAEPFSKFTAPYCDHLINVAEEFRQPVHWSIAAFVILIAVVLTFRITASLLFQSRPRWQGMDSWLGAALGALQGVVVSGLLLLSLVILEPLAQQHLTRSQEVAVVPYAHSVSARVVALADQTRASSLGKIMDAMEPIQARFNQRVHNTANSVIRGQQEGVPSQQIMTRLFEGIHGD